MLEFSLGLGGVYVPFFLLFHHWCFSILIHLFAWCCFYVSI
jgi:hypothetical protein